MNRSGVTVDSASSQNCKSTEAPSISDATVAVSIAAPLLANLSSVFPSPRIVTWAINCESRTDRPKY